MNMADSCESCTTPFSVASPSLVPASSWLTTVGASRSMSASIPDIAAQVAIEARAT